MNYKKIFFVSLLFLSLSNMAGLGQAGGKIFEISVETNYLNIYDSTDAEHFFYCYKESMPDTTKFIINKNQTFKISVVLSGTPFYVSCNDEFKTEQLDLVVDGENVSIKMYPLDKPTVESSATCISSPDQDNIKVTYAIPGLNYPNDEYNLYLHSFYIEKSGNKVYVNSALLPNDQNETYISYNDIGDESSYGKTLYFELWLKTDYYTGQDKGCLIPYTGNKGNFRISENADAAITFQKKITGFSVDQSNIEFQACNPRIKIPVSMSDDLYDDYLINLIDINTTPNCEEGGSATMLCSKEGNKYYLTYENEDIEEQYYNIGCSDGDYKLQFESAEDKYCKYSIDYSYSSTKIVEPLEITDTDLTTYSFTPEGGDLETYHITRPGASNGEVTLTLSDGSRFGKFQYKLNNGAWTDVDAGNISGTGNTRTISNLGPYEYDFKVIDMDGCNGDSISLDKLKDPDPVKVNSFEYNKPECHINNGGFDPASVYIEYSGGIGPYKIHIMADHDIYGENLILYTEVVNTLSKNITIDRLSGESNEDLYKIWDNYKVWIYDSKNNGADQPFGLTMPKELTLNFLHTDNTCPGGKTGSVQYIVNDYYKDSISDYLLDEGPGYLPVVPDANNTVGQLAAGTYSIKVSKGSCYEERKNFEIGEPDQIQLTSITKEKVKEYGKSTGSFEASITGGTPPYNYEFVGKQNDSVYANGSTPSEVLVENLSGGEYLLEVSDSNDCIEAFDVKIEEPDSPLTLEIVDTNHVDCHGQTTGYVTLSASGGWPPYEFGINGLIKGNETVLGGLDASGAYPDTVFVKDLEGVTRKLSINIEQPDSSLAISGSYIYGLTCYQDSSGAIKLDITGGTKPYFIQYDDNDPVQGDSLSNLHAGNISLNVIDMNGCQITMDTNIPEPKPFVAAIENTYGLSCYGDTNGAVKLSITGGTQPYELSVDSSNWHITDSLGGLSQNPALDIYARDSNHCQDMVTAIITEPAPLQLSIKTHHLSCYGDSSGSVKLQSTGGTKPYRYQLLGDLYINDSISGLSAMTQEIITVEDSNACKTSKNITINQPPKFMAELKEYAPVKCYGDSNAYIKLKAEGGVGNYQISVNAEKWIEGTHLYNLKSGDDTFSVRDGNLCMDTVFVPDSYNEPKPIEIGVSYTVDPLCFGDETGEIGLDITGGTNPYYLSTDQEIWTEGNVLKNLSADTAFSIFVTDTHGCVNSINATISQPKELRLIVDSVTATQCSKDDGGVYVSISGGTVSDGYEFDWYNIDTETSLTGDSILTGIPSGLYRLQVTDDNGCKDVLEAGVSDADGPVLESWHADSATCHDKADGKIYIDQVKGGTGSYSYFLDKQTTGSIIPDLSGGTYNIKIKDEQDCESNNILTVPSPDSIVVTYDITAPSCHLSSNGSISTKVKGGTPNYEYLWNTGETAGNIATLTKGIYTLQITDKKECTHEENIKVRAPDRLELIPALIGISCHGEDDASIYVEAKGGTQPYLFSWSDSDTANFKTGLGAGSYKVSVSDANNCLEDTLLNIADPEPINLDAKVTHPLCHGAETGSIEITAEGGRVPYTYLWSNGATGSFNRDIGEGQYMVELYDKNSCRADSQYTVTSPDALEATAKLTHLNCHGESNGSIELEVSGGTGTAKVTWKEIGAGLFKESLPAGRYVATIIDSNLCEQQKVFTLKQPAAIDLNPLIVPPTCFGSGNGQISVDVTGGVPPYVYSWSNGGTGTYIDQLDQGEYSLNVEDSVLCQVNKEFLVTAPAVPSAHWPTDSGVVCTGNVKKLDGGVFADYTWYKDGDSVSTGRYYSLSETGLYELVLTDSNGCTGKDTFYLEVSDEPLKANLLLPDSAVAGQYIRVIDITWPVPDSIQWHYDKPVFVAEGNEWSEVFNTEGTGELNVTLTAWYGGCFSDSSKNIIIYHDAMPDSLKSAGYEPLILDYRVYPNPNNGRFFMQLELSRKKDALLYLYRMSSSKLVDTKKLIGKKEYGIQYDLTSLMPDVYVLLITTGHESQALKIIIE